MFVSAILNTSKWYHNNYPIHRQTVIAKKIAMPPASFSCNNTFMVAILLSRAVTGGNILSIQKDKSDRKEFILQQGGWLFWPNSIKYHSEVDSLETCGKVTTFWYLMYVSD